MTVEVDEADRPESSTQTVGLQLRAIEEPTFTQRSRTAIRFAGIGGTGVVTAAHIIGTAAMLAGIEVDGVDQTGLSQKAGPVVSDLILTTTGEGRHSSLVATQSADVVIGFDQLVAAADSTISAIGDGTVVFASSSTTPTGPEVADPANLGDTAETITARLRTRCGPEQVDVMDTLGLAKQLVGQQSTANLLLLGVAFQSGQLPIPGWAIRQAIELNGVAVAANCAAFDWGRRWLIDRSAVEQQASGNADQHLDFAPGPVTSKIVERIGRLRLGDELAVPIEKFCGDLIEYQDEAYALRYLALIEEAAETGDADLVDSVARGFHKLMAYKDEYEVARLMLRQDGLAVAEQFGGLKAGVHWQLHPPMLKALGVDKKLSFGPRSASGFRALARGKRLRGTAFDPFGRTELRRLERRLIDQYESRMLGLCRQLRSGSTTDQTRLVAAIAALPEMIRGFEDLKVRRVEEYESRLAELLGELPATQAV